MESKTKLLQLRTEEFENEVLRSSLPAVVDFYADWCGPCQTVSPLIESLSKEYDGKVKFVKVDTDKNPDLAERYGVMSIPTVFIFKDGQVKERIVGAAPVALYRKKIEAALEQSSSEPASARVQRLTCSTCGMELNSQAELMEHAKRAHSM